MRRFLLLILIFGSVVIAAAQTQYTSHYVALDTSWHSTALDQIKPTRVILPKGFTQGSETGYPLYVIFDMQNAINFDFIVRTIDYLSTFDQIPQGVIVGVESLPDMGRYYETQLKVNSDKALGAQNAGFIFDELIPYVRDKFSATAGTVLIGHSRYGFFTTHLLTEYFSELLGVISISPFFEQNNSNHVERMKSLLENIELEHDLYYIPAIGDSIVDTGDYYRMMSMIEEMELPDRFHMYGLEYPSGDHYTTPGLSVGNALYKIYRGWNEYQLEYYRSSTDHLKLLHDTLQTKIAQDYGSEIPLSLGVYNGTGWRYNGEENLNSAMASWSLMGKYYPKYSYSWLFLAEQELERGNMDAFDAYIEKARTSLIDNTILNSDELIEARQYIEELLDKRQ